jgi:hypothetical protein
VPGQPVVLLQSSWFGDRVHGQRCDSNWWTCAGSACCIATEVNGSATEFIVSVVLRDLNAMQSS